MNRGMDRLRRSFRKSFHLGHSKGRLTANEAGRGSPTLAETSTSNCVGAGSKPNAFQPDEASVRAGNCQFQVKVGPIFSLSYCILVPRLLRSLRIAGNASLRERAESPQGELFSMRVLLYGRPSFQSKKRSVKAILYVSGDSLRVVDQESNRGLILDQTVEKVSFCAPDRNNDKGFAYICRDGATRRWMCHGFMAVKESVRSSVH